MIAAMRRPLAWLVVVTAMLAGASIVRAAQTSYLDVTGPATGPGTCNITIESFGTLLTGDKKGIDTKDTTPPIYHANCPIPGGSSPASTAMQLTACIDAVLPAEYTVTYVAPTRVQIFRNVGTFTIQVDEDIPTQQVTVVTAGVPGSDTGRLMATALGVFLAGTVFLLRRRRVA